MNQEEYLKAYEEALAEAKKGERWKVLNEVYKAIDDLFERELLDGWDFRKMRGYNDVSRMVLEMQRECMK